MNIGGLDLAVKIAQLCIPIFLGLLIWMDARVRAIERNVAEHGATKEDVIRLEHGLDRVHARIDAMGTQLTEMPGEIVALVKGVRP